MKIILRIIIVAILAILKGDSDYKDNIKKSFLEFLLKEILVWLLHFFLQMKGIYIDIRIIKIILNLLCHLYYLFFYSKLIK